MGIPEYILLALLLLGLGIDIAGHGQPREGTNNAWSSVISIVLLIGLLYWGGFFN